VPDYNALVGPMLYNNMEEYTAMCHSDFANSLNEKAEENGMKVLALDYGFGFRHICANKPVRNPKDLSGMKLRVPKSNLWIETLSAMCANPIPMAWSEVYSAVQQGVVVGLETSISDIADNQMGAIIKDISLTGHFCGTTCCVMSKKIWDSFTPEQQQIVEEEFLEGAKRNNERVAQQEIKDRESLGKEGVKFHEVEKDEFRALTKKVFENNKNLTPGVYDTIQAELTKIRGK
jgi:TRAP dicarboxylate transporter- dctP subunit